jgi:hypothetical protein
MLSNDLFSSINTTTCLIFGSALCAKAGWEVAAADGLSGTESNPDLAGAPVLVNSSKGTSAGIMTTPDPNPGESWVDINEQLFDSTELPAAGQVPGMNGFVRNYLKQRKKSADREPDRIMHHFTPEQVPVISQLAREFAVSDRWFASAPCQTWPNRFFLHTGTANGYENNFPPHFPYRMPTIFERLHAMDSENGWRVYFHDIAQASALSIYGASGTTFSVTAPSGKMPAVERCRRMPSLSPTIYRTLVHRMMRIRPRARQWESSYWQTCITRCVRGPPGLQRCSL